MVKRGSSTQTRVTPKLSTTNYSSVIRHRLPPTSMHISLYMPTRTASKTSREHCDLPARPHLLPRSPPPLLNSPPMTLPISLSLLLPMPLRIAALPGDGTGPEVVREGLKVLAATGFRLDLRVRPRRRALQEDRRHPPRLRPRGAARLRRHLPRRHRPPGRRARHPREEPPPAPALRAGRVHQPAPVKLYPGVDCPLKDKGPTTSTSSSSARTPRDCTAAWAASSTKGRRRRPRRRCT